MTNAQAPPVGGWDAAVTNAQAPQRAGGGGSGSGSDSGRGGVGSDSGRGGSGSGSGSGSASGTGSGAGSGEGIAWRGATIMRSCAYGSCVFSAVIQYLAHALQAVPSFIRRAVTGACVCVCGCVCVRARAQLLTRLRFLRGSPSWGPSATCIRRADCSRIILGRLRRRYS